ncbi:hypothetical protein D3C87_1281980 [compost metagenome]
MTILHLTVSIIYIALTVYFIIKANRYPQQVFGKQYANDVVIVFIIIWYAFTFIIIMYLLYMVPWDKKIF